MPHAQYDARELVLPEREKLNIKMGPFFRRSPSSLSSVEKAKRDVALGLKRLPVVSWLYQPKDVNHLLLVPRDLRTADPSFSIELDMGQFGLAGATVLLEGASPFHADPPNLSWQQELHGFGWIRNLRAARSERSQQQALELLESWINSFRSQKGVAWEPGVTARRLISWLSHSNFLLNEADEELYMDLMISIDDHMRFLSMAGVHANPGLPRLLSLISLVFAGLCVANQEKFLDQQVKLLCNELDRQIFSDGGHISRDNSVLASILLDLLPLKQCFVTRKFEVPPPLQDSIGRMLPMINYMRLGDGLLSRFNGAGTTLPDTLSTAMAYDDVSNTPLEKASSSYYFRLQRGNVVVLMDGGGPPPLEISQKSHAGCLSFEMSSGTCPLIVNCGAAPPAFHTMANNARATVCHSTLTVNNRSSAQFLHEEKLRSEEHTSLLEGPALVEARYERSGDQHKIVASHDGYLAQFGIIHNRLLSLSNDGYTLIGEDWIELPMGHDVIQKGLGWPFAVHFHIHPDVVPARTADGKSVILTLPDSQVWTFSANDMVIHLEESIFYADFAGPCQSVQIVIRGNCLGPVSIPWKLSKSIQSSTPDPKNVPDWISGNVISLESALEEQSEQPEKDDKSPDKEKTQKAGGMTKPKITDLVEDTDDEVAADDDKPVKKTSPDDQVSTDQRVEAKTDKPSTSQIRKRKKRARHNAPSHFAKLKPVADKSDTDNQPPPLPKTGGALKGDQPPPPPSGKTGRNTAIIKGEKGGQQKDAKKGGRVTTDKTATNNKGKEAPLSPQPPPMPKPKRDDE